MEIPLRLQQKSQGGCVYSLPLWFRILMGALLAIVAGSQWATAEAPSPGAWIVIAILLLGFLYQERWDFDPSTRRIQHQAGILFLARPRNISFDQVEALCLTVIARGTVPGSTEDRAQVREAFKQMEGRDSASLDAGGPGGFGGAKAFFSRFSPRQSFMNLVLRTTDGDSLLIDTCPARKGLRLKKAGLALAQACGKLFIEEIPE